MSLPIHAEFERCVGQFETSLGVNSKYIISSREAEAYREHVVFGEPIMPATSYLAIAMSELAQSGELSLSLVNAKVSSVYRLGKNQLPEIVIIRSSNTIELASVAKQIYFKARIPSSSTDIENWILPKYGWINEESESKLKATYLYRHFFPDRVKLNYGPNFRKLSRINIHPDSDTIKATLTQPSSVWNDLVIDPGALDSALQAIAALALYKAGEETFSRPAIPVKFGTVSIRLLSSKQQVICETVFIKVTAYTQGAVQFDLLILDPLGVPVFSIHNGLLAEVESTQIIHEAK